MIQTGLDAAMEEYLNGGVSRFIQHRERMESYLATRELPGSSTAAAAGASGKADEGEESDASEVYMDACEDAPMESPAAITSAAPSVVAAGATSAAPLASPVLTSVTASPLPEWHTGPSVLPRDPLAANPLSEWHPPPAVANASALPAPPPDFPREWTTLVASDVVHMAMDTQHPATAAEETAGPGESSPSVRRLSDAYIAGMPSKRRRVRETPHVSPNQP